MEDFQHFYLGPQESVLSRLTEEATSITVMKTGGERLVLEPRAGRVTVSEEHHQVDRMEGDWGAICEVFKQQRFYYITLQGTRLAVGDQLVFGLPEAREDTTGPEQVILKVVSVENDRARVEASK